MWRGGTGETAEGRTDREGGEEGGWREVLAGYNGTKLLWILDPRRTALLLAIGDLLHRMQILFLINTSASADLSCLSFNQPPSPLSTHWQLTRGTTASPGYRMNIRSGPTFASTAERGDWWPTRFVERDGTGMARMVRGGWMARGWKVRRGGRRILFVARDFSSNFSSKGFSTKFASIKWIFERGFYCSNRKEWHIVSNVRCTIELRITRKVLIYIHNRKKFSRFDQGDQNRFCFDRIRTYERTWFQNKIPHSSKGLNARNIRGIKKASCASNGRLPSIDTEIVVAWRESRFRRFFWETPVWQSGQACPRWCEQIVIIDTMASVRGTPWQDVAG